MKHRLHTRTHFCSVFSPWLGVLLLTMMLLAAGATASAQTLRFRVTDLTILRFEPNADIDGTMGINNLGEAVYAYKPPAGSNLVPWFWLPYYNHGFSPGEIHPLAGCVTPGIARDFNDNGVAAGASGSGTARTAAVWTVDAGSVTCNILGGYSEAHALDNDAPPNIVGWHELSTWCAEPIYHNLRAFTWKPGVSLSDLNPVGTYAGIDSLAFDIPPSGSGTIVGISADCEIAPCFPTFEGTAWSPTGNVLGLGDIRATALWRKAWLYGVNNSARICGWVTYSPDGSACYDTAALWFVDPIDLGLHMPIGQGSHKSRAYALNRLNPPQIVGANRTLLLAILWEYDGSTWVGRDLNTLILNCGGWTIREAHDINEHGWIIAWGTRVVNDQTEHHALLLTPIGDCPEDIDHDGDVDVDDLNLVLWSDGNCPAHNICWGDVNLDCVINTADFKQIMRAYGPCNGEGSGLSQQSLNLWFAAGGSQGIAQRQISAHDVAACLNESTPGDRLAALFHLIIP